MPEAVSFVIAKYNYWVYVALMMIGVYALIVKRNLVKKIIGMNIMQTAIILFYISVGSKRGATLPILQHTQGHASHSIQSADYINPLPHVLMLTAIVVAVATLGVALSIAVKIYQQYNTLDEAEIHRKIRSEQNTAP